MNLDTLSIQIFIAVAQTRSFTRAAESVGRTQSAVSQQIAKLEALVGKRLFMRERGLALTAEGEVFFSYAKQIFSLHREVLDRFKEPELEGRVRFGLPEDFAHVFLSDVLVDFSRIHPRILLDIECDLTLNLFERFKNHEFDMVLVKMDRPEDFPNGQEVWSEPLEWLGDPRLIESGGPVPLVVSPEPCVYRAGAIRALEAAGRSWRIVFSSPSYTVSAAAVAAGMGVTVLPHTMAPKGVSVLESGKLPPLEDVHVSLLKHESDNAAINSFEDFALVRLR